MPNQTKIFKCFLTNNKKKRPFLHEEAKIFSKNNITVRTIFQGNGKKKTSTKEIGNIVIKEKKRIKFAVIRLAVGDIIIELERSWENFIINIYKIVEINKETKEVKAECISSFKDKQWTNEKAKTYEEAIKNAKIKSKDITHRCYIKKEYSNEGIIRKVNRQVKMAKNKLQ